jgi:hypothetical protein
VLLWDLRLILLLRNGGWELTPINPCLAANQRTQWCYHTQARPDFHSSRKQAASVDLMARLSKRCASNRWLEDTQKLGLQWLALYLRRREIKRCMGTHGHASTLTPAWSHPVLAECKGASIQTPVSCRESMEQLLKYSIYSYGSAHIGLHIVATTWLLIHGGARIFQHQLAAELRANHELWRPSGATLGGRIHPASQLRGTRQGREEPCGGRPKPLAMPVPLLRASPTKYGVHRVYEDCFVQ